ncbi:hypothetical protein [Leucobacter ruminantium]|uniref:Uncharacterized protein n=1 Tax=Leucobacter ruminantium TaxID=1289170 RepID=A0A939LX74_9MICO|nr:hypothetical protein [Leucobacter ruminantium]MBO1804047.1 hypothetical protein [Leucobacter ruminantium]
MSSPDQQPEPQQYAQPRYAPPQQQYAQAHAQQQYAADLGASATQHHYQQAPYQQAPHPQAPIGAPTASPTGERLNLLGVIALALLVLLALLSFIQPLFYRQAAMVGDFSTLSMVLAIIHAGVTFAALGLAIGGVLQRTARRLRWTAVGSLVAGGLALLSMIGNLVGGWISSALPY